MADAGLEMVLAQGLGKAGAQSLCSNLPDALREHHVQPGVGHYGVFNGSRFRAEIVPKIRVFTGAHQQAKGVFARAFSRTA